VKLSCPKAVSKSGEPIHILGIQETQVTMNEGLMPSHRITSYINSLDPENHGDLYAVVERIIEQAIPFHSGMLPLRQSEVANGNDELNTTTLNNKYNYNGLDDEDIDDETWETVTEEEEAALDEKYHQNKDTILPDAGGFVAPSLPISPMVDLRRDYAHRGLQIILKLANIELTPDKPESEGGNWHVSLCRLQIDPC
jgi:hypothetical protein